MKSIILVDDDTNILEIFKLIFERAGYKVDIFNKGDLLMINQFDEPDIFILDKHLGGADGLDLCRYLKGREQFSHTPVIIFSATPHMDAEAKSAGADDFIEKPFKSKDLLAMIEKHLGQKAA